MSGITIIEAVNAALHDAMGADDRVLLLGEDVGPLGGAFRASDGLYEQFGDRVVDMPIAEAGTVGVAVGLCLAGYRPIVELQFDTFAYPAFEQIVSHVARYRWRTAGHAGMPMVLRVPFGGGVHAPELHSDSPEALFAHMPGLKVVCPSSPQDAYGLLRWAIESPDPVVVMEPKKLYRSTRGPVERDGPARDAQALRTVRAGDDVTLVTYGSSVMTCEAVAEQLADEVSVEVLDLRSLYPMDAASVLESVRRTGRCVVVHEAPRFAGLGAEVAAIIAAEALYQLRAPVLRVTGLDVPFPLYANEHDYLPSVGRVEDAVREVLEA